MTMSLCLNVEVSDYPYHFRPYFQRRQKLMYFIVNAYILCILSSQISTFSALLFSVFLKK